MKLNNVNDSDIFYRFGDKRDRLSDLKRGDLYFFCNEKKITQNSLVLSEQTHSSKVYNIISKDISGLGFTYFDEEISEVDGFVTAIEGIFLVIKTADCIPILFYDKVKKVIAAVHSGREGTQESICKNALDIMVNEYNSWVQDIHVMIGPSICKENYEVDELTFNKFIKATKVLQEEYRKLDLKKVVINNLKEYGILENNIIVDTTCTYNSDKYFSYRKDKTTERQISIIGLMPKIIEE